VANGEAVKLSNDRYRAGLTGEFIRRSQREEQRARTKNQIIELLRAEGERWCQWLEAQPLELLAEAVRMPGGAPEPPRAAARHEGTRNASPGAVDCDRAIAGHRAALHPAAAGSAREVGVLNYDGSMPMARRRIQNARTSSKTFTVGRKT